MRATRRPQVVMARLAGAMPAPVAGVLGRLRRLGGAWVVGGACRSAALGLPPVDWDLACSLSCEQVAACFPRVLTHGAGHGTVTVLAQGHAVEVTSLRGEAGNLDDDLARRDFTINAMAADLVGGRWHDPGGGLADLAAGHLRCPGRAIDRLAADPLRALRAARLVAQLPLEADATVLSAMAAVDLRAVAPQRQAAELSLLLAAPHLARGIGCLGHIGRLSVGDALTSAPAALWQQVQQVAPRTAAARLAAWAWLANAAAVDLAQLAASWQLPSALGRTAAELAGALWPLAAGQPLRGAQLRRWAARRPQASLGAALLAARRWPAAHADLPARVRRFLGQPSARPAGLLIGGADLARLGVPPARRRLLLQQLHQQVLDCPQRNRRPWLLRAALAAAAPPCDAS